MISSFGDQLFWGDLVMKLGTGPSPIPKAELTVDRLAAAITIALSDPVMQQQAKAIGQQFEQEMKFSKRSKLWSIILHILNIGSLNVLEKS